jgi:adenosylhomocysteine nucleosidase
MNKKVFIVAVPNEVDIQGNILGYPVIFSGVGKINAAMAAMSALHLGYNEIINIGSCGSLRLPVGEIAKVGQVFQDIDATPLDEYGVTPFDANATIEASISFTLNAKCLKPQDSGWEGRAGGLGKENNSMI